MDFNQSRQAAAERVRAYRIRLGDQNAGPFTRLVLLVLGILILLLALALLIPLILIAIVVALVLIAYARVRVFFAGRRSRVPSEGRENVRVMTRD
ncbi:MAG: hypothetical protein AAGB51_05790 [Planctomycetota bacterium]